MIKRMAIVLLMFMLFICHVEAQGNKVNVSCREDGKKADIKYKIKFYVQDKESEPNYVEGGFILPEDLDSAKIGVKIIFEKAEINFGQINQELLKTDWVIGVDNKPYEKANVGHLPGESRDQGNLLYYLEFRDKGLIKYKITIFK
jgi:hypothetical protein